MYRPTPSFREGRLGGGTAYSPPFTSIFRNLQSRISFWRTKSRRLTPSTLQTVLPSLNSRLGHRISSVAVAAEKKPCRRGVMAALEQLCVRDRVRLSKVSRLLPRTVSAVSLPRCVIWANFSHVSWIIATQRLTCIQVPD
jgi:hypothetical protein